MFTYYDDIMKHAHSTGQKLLITLMMFLLTEITLTWLGVDDLCDYAEFIFHQEKEQIMFVSISYEAAVSS